MKPEERKAWEEIVEAFLLSLSTKTEISSDHDCVLWVGARRSVDGYGAFCIGNKVYPAHRLMYKIAIGGIPPKYLIHHICGNTNCINPSHLETMNFRAHFLIGASPPAVNHMKCECVHGHPFNKKNTRIFNEKNRIRRACRACGRDAYNRHREAKNNLVMPRCQAELRRRVE